MDSTFRVEHRIVSHSQTGKVIDSPEKQENIEKEIAYHSGWPKRAFDLGELKADEVENADETHFLINMDNAENTGFEGGQQNKTC